MSDVNVWNSYNIDDLAAVLKRGWQELARFCEKRKFDTGKHFGRSSLYPSVRVYYGFHRVFYYLVPVSWSLQWSLESLLNYGLIDLFALAATPNNKSYESRKSLNYWPLTVSAELQMDRKTELKVYKIIKRITKAFASSETIGDAFQKISTRKQLRQFIHCRDESLMKRLLATRINTSWTEVFQWLDCGLESNVACDEAWWRCVSRDVSPMVQELLEVKRRIDADVPLTSDHYCLLNMLMMNGYPYGCCLPDANGRQVYTLVLTRPRRGRAHDYQITDIADPLLTQPAFNLASELKRRCSEGRFIGTCRAPSCGKEFYTGRKNSTACPSERNHAKSLCALEWVRYRRYLIKIHKNPEQDWNSDKFQEDFITYDND